MCSHSQKTLSRILSKFTSFPPPTPQHLQLAHTITLTLLNNPYSKLHPSLIPCISPHVTYRVLSDPTLPPLSCLTFFNFLPSPDLNARLILLYRLFAARRFAAMRTLLDSLVTTEIETKRPVSDVVSLVDECDFEPHFVETLCDMLFRVCADNRMFRDALKVFDYVMEKGLVVEGRSCFILLLALKKCNKVELCVRFFRRMVESGRVDIGVQSLTIVVDVLCRRGEVGRAKELMNEMATRGVVRPTVFTYNTLLNACVVRKDREGVDEILGLMEREGVVASLVTYTILIEWYASSGRIGEAEKVYEEMCERNVEMDVYVYTSMISWNCRAGNVRRASALFDEMICRGIVPNTHTFGTLISGVCKAGQMEAAEILLEEMQCKGVDLNVVIFNTMMDGYCKRGMMDEAFRLQDIMERKGFEADVFTYSILASGLCKLHRYEEAKRVLNVMVEKGVAPNVVTCATFIEIYCKEGNLAEAERFLRNMEKRGVVPNIVTYNTLIDAYSKNEKVKRAHMLKAEMVEKGLLPDVFTYTSLIHGECIVDKVDEALKLFNEMLVKGIRGNVKTYTAIISGLSKEGRADEAFKLYDEMMRMGLIPDDRVFEALVGSLHKPSSHAAVKENEYGELKINTSDTSSLPNTGFNVKYKSYDEIDEEKRWWKIPFVLDFLKIKGFDSAFRKVIGSDTVQAGQFVEYAFGQLKSFNNSYLLKGQQSDINNDKYDTEGSRELSESVSIFNMPSNEAGSQEASREDCIEQRNSNEFHKQDNDTENGHASESSSNQFFWRNFANVVNSSIPQKLGLSVPEKFKWDGLEFLNKIGSQSQNIAESIYVQSGLAIPGGTDDTNDKTSSQPAIAAFQSSVPEVKKATQNLMRQTESILGGLMLLTATVSKIKDEGLCSEERIIKEDSAKARGNDIQYSTSQMFPSSQNGLVLDDKKTEEMKELFSTAESAMEAWAMLATSLGQPSFIKSEFEKLCFLDNASTDTQVAIWRDSARRRLVVAFRGTEQTQWKDLRTDLMLVPAGLNPERIGGLLQVHSGFLSAYDSVRTRIISLIRLAIGYVYVVLVKKFYYIELTAFKTMLLYFLIYFENPFVSNLKLLK